MSVAWFSRLYRLNEAGRFDEVVTASKKYLAARPKDYALHLQLAKALLSLGRLEEAAVHLDAAVNGSKGLAAWPWFYRAALHARNGERKAMYGAMQTTLRLDPKLGGEFEHSPFFAAHWASRPFRALTRTPQARRKSPPLDPARGEPVKRTLKPTRAGRGTAKRPGER